MTINLTGVFASVQSLFSHRKERRYDRIVVVSSVAAQGGPTTDQAGLGIYPKPACLLKASERPAF